MHYLFLFRMYSRLSERNNWKMEVVSVREGDHGGFKELVTRIQGSDVYMQLKFEAGVHRVQRVPQTETQGRVHTSAATCMVFPEAEEFDVDLSVRLEPMWKVLGFVLLGILGLRFGASFFVEGAAGIALDFGVSERVISVTMVAFGTSVPELVASLIAARRNEKDLAIGNLLGSNIFNILAVLGITSLITPIPVQDEALFSFDYWW